MVTRRTLLAQLMSERNFSQEDLERKFEQAAKELKEGPVSVSPRQLGRWLSGSGGTPRPVARRILEHLFGYPIDELLAPPLAGGPSLSMAARIDRRLLHNADSPAMRSLTTDTDLIRTATGRARDFGLLVGSAAMSQELPDQLYDDLRHLGSIYPTVPLSEILSDLVSAQDSVYGLLESRRSPNQARQLYFLAGVASGMLAKASHDLAEPHAALTQARTAFICAEQADHPGLMAWVRSLQSLIAYWAGRPAESARYAQHAQEVATAGVGTARLWAYLAEARALASSGDRTSARQLIGIAEDERASTDNDELDEIGGLFTFGPVRQLYYAGDALSWIGGEAVEAAAYSSQAVEGYGDHQSGEWAFGDQAGAHANLAIARLTLGEPEGAREAISPVLALPPSQRANGIVLSAQRVGRALAQSSRGLDHVELQHEIEEFCRVPLAALPR